MDALLVGEHRAYFEPSVSLHDYDVTLLDFMVVVTCLYPISFAPVDIGRDG